MSAGRNSLREFEMAIKSAPDHVAEIDVVLGKCKICRGKAIDVFFGIPSCKVCRGIFKRGLKKKFECVSESEGSCEVKRGSSTQCKACIFAKCVRKGMVAKESTATSSVEKPKVKKEPKHKNQEKKQKAVALAEKNISKSKLVASTSSQPERFYQVEADLKSLFQHDESTKPFSFFDTTVTETEDEFSIPNNFGSKNSVFPSHNFYDEEAEESDAHGQSTMNQRWNDAPFHFPPQQKETFFFTENDPRIEEGLRYFSMTKEELAESIEIWKKIRPQLAADFKKIKKQANRKRKTFER